MYTSKACVVALFALLAIGASNAEGQKPSWQDRLKKKVSKVLADSSESAPTAGASSSGETKGVTAGPRNRNPRITGVWEGALLTPSANPNRYAYRLSITQRDALLSGEARIEVPGKPLQFVVYSIDGSVEDGLIKFNEVAQLRGGSDMPYCGGVAHRMTVIVRDDGAMVGDVVNGHGLGHGGTCPARLDLTQVSTDSPEATDGAPGAGVSPSASATAPAATMVPNPNVTGTWSGTVTMPRGNPNRYTYRLDVTQRDGAVIGTARLQVPNEPLQFVVQNVKGTVDEGIITLETGEIVKQGSANVRWCSARLVMLLKTDGTLTGEWTRCNGDGNVYLTKPK